MCATLMYGDAVVLESGDKENNPLNQAITSALGSKPLDLKNKEDQATISAAVKAVEKKFGQINNMREDSSVFAKNLLLAAALFCDLLSRRPSQNHAAMSTRRPSARTSADPWPRW